jgi:hypothetical protein
VESGRCLGDGRFEIRHVEWTGKITQRNLGRGERETGVKTREEEQGIRSRPPG